jgi:hypothetical protein
MHSSFLDLHFVEPVATQPLPPSPQPLDPVPPSLAEPVFTVPCSWKQCGQDVTATRSDMKRAARAHLKRQHGNDLDLVRNKGVIKQCQCTGCLCTKLDCFVDGPHALHSETVRTHVVRYHFVRLCV